MTAARTFSLPDLGEGLTEAEILTWRVAEGDDVTVDDIVVEVETAKAAVEVPCPFAGRVATLHAAVGDVVAVGHPLMTVAEPVDAVDAVDAAADPSRPTIAADPERSWWVTEQVMARPDVGNQQHRVGDTWRRG